MTTIATTTFQEEGTLCVTVVFTDEDGDSVTPNTDTIKWTLTNKPAFGTTPTVINSREQEDIESSSTINIVLSGDDLSLLSAESGNAFVERIVTIEYEYDSSLGSDLKGKAQYVFRIENLQYV